MAVRLPLLDRAIPIIAALMGATFGAVTELESAIETVLGGAFVALVTAAVVLLVTKREPRVALRSRVLRMARGASKSAGSRRQPR